MKILIAPDKFKGSLNAREVCDAIIAGLNDFVLNAEIDSIPLADGGEGTCELLTEWHSGSKVDVVVKGPLFAPVPAYYGLSNAGDVAFIEMSVASGLTLLKSQDRNPLFTTTFGTGELIAHALDSGIKQIILGIGGSATNDGGIGMAMALGYGFYDIDGTPLKPTGENLIHIHHLQRRDIHSRLGKVQVIALCDVSNPLCGPDGAAYIYGPQKGADERAVQLLDAGLRNFRRVVHKSLKTSVDFPGAGAAGGLGAGAKVFLGATMEKGIAHMIKATGLEGKIREADLVITGEGKIDSQTFAGKVVSEVARLARKSRKTVIAICGKCELPSEQLEANGLNKVISLVDDQTRTEFAIQNAFSLIRKRISEECPPFMKA